MALSLIIYFDGFDYISVSWVDSSYNLFSTLAGSLI